MEDHPKYLQDAINRARSADDKAERARMAFVMGKGPEYIAEQLEEIKNRMEASYARSSNTTATVG